MAQFSVHPALPGGKGYVVNVQTEVLDHLNTRVVIPLLYIEDVYTPTKTLNPVFEIEGRRVLLATHYIATVPAKQLRAPMTRLTDEQSNEVIGAINLLVQRG